MNELDWWIASQWEMFKIKEGKTGLEFNKTDKEGNVLTVDRTQKWNKLRAKTDLKEMYIVRYADDFKLFCRDYATAKKVMCATKLWLAENLHLQTSGEKSGITNLRKNYTTFLGIKFKVVPKGSKWVIRSHMADKSKAKVIKKLSDVWKDIKNPSKQSEIDRNISLYNAKIHKKGKEDKLVVIFHAGLGSIDEFLPFIQGLCNEEKGTIVSIALNNVKQYLDFYAGHLYESVADKYTKIILDLGYDKIQLIGHCVGGMIAFEVAKNMMDKGVDVIDVSLIDSIPGKYSIEDEVVMELMFLPMVNITYPVLAEYQLNERELYEYMDEKFGKYTGIEQKSKNKVEEYINGLREIEKEERIRLYINSVSKNMPIQMFVYLFDIFKQSTNGAIYKPIPYLGDIRLFIAEDTEKIVFHRSEEVINFWRENCIGDVTVIMIPGNHLTCFTDVNNIQKLVNMITEK